MVILSVALDVNRNILCLSLKIWTRAIGGLGLIGCLVAAVVGGVIIGAGELNGFRGPDSLIVLIILTFTGLAVLIHVLLLLGNEVEKPGFFLPWLILNLIAMGLSSIGLFRLILKGGRFPSILTFPGLLGISTFSLYVVHQRYNETYEDGILKRFKNLYGGNAMS